MGKNGTAASELVRYTSSHTPPQGYETLGRMFVVIVPESLKIARKLHADYETALVGAAGKILKTLIPQATVQTVEVDAEKDSKHWARITLDTPETVKQPKTTRSAARKADKMADLAATIDLNRLFTRVRELKAAGSDGQAALLAAGKEQNLGPDSLVPFGYIVRKAETKAAADTKAAKTTSKSK